MATINLLGWETGDSAEVAASGGTFSVQSTTKRTGNYALRCNPAASAAGWHRITAYAATGLGANIARTAQTYYTVYFQFASLPSGTVRFLIVMTSGDVEVVRVNCDSSGNITLTGTTTSATVATISAGVWYRADLRVTSNGTSGLAIDGGSEQTITANNLTQDRFYCGRTITTEAVAFDCYYDDALISDSGFPGAGEVRRLLPNGAGTYSGWTNGTGTTYAECDDDAPGNDGDTTYIKALDTQDNTAHTFTMQDTATVGLIGTVTCVKNMGVVRTESTTGASTVGNRLRSSSTDSDTTGAEWVTTYGAARAKLFDTDPATGAAWTLSGIDGIECGVYAGTIAQHQRCTAVYAMVWTDGVVPPATTPPGWYNSRGGWW